MLELVIIAELLLIIDISNTGFVELITFNSSYSGAKIHRFPSEKGVDGYRNNRDGRSSFLT